MHVIEGRYQDIVDFSILTHTVANYGAIRKKEKKNTSFRVMVLAVEVFKNISDRENYKSRRFAEAKNVV